MAIAINCLFKGKHAPRSSTKSMTGNKCWIAGASEIVYSIIMVQSNFVDPIINFEKTNEHSEKLKKAIKTIETELNVVLSNSFGFGGTNSTLVIRRM